MNGICVVGLGNPGALYDNTPHNIGFMMLEAIASCFGANEFSKKFDGYVSSCETESRKLMLFKPYTYMNNSGLPLLKLVSFYKILCGNIIVIHDDIDLHLGKIKVKKGGGNAGHNGLGSIDKNLGKNYWRLRVGVGRPDQKDASHYVLSKFSKEVDVEGIIEDTLSYFKSMLNERVAVFSDDE